ncbi:hypothetical protein HB777_18790 [Mesorhizobium loti]|nr:hypothetical protein HB777_18790 [Mesorhizobium loti]
MIIGPDFVWLHFPKCAGSSLELALRDLLANRSDIHFDDIDDVSSHWHNSISQRQESNPSFDPSGKLIIACVRRLPSWIISRVQFEATRHDQLVASREMIVSGKFFEPGGEVNSADDYMTLYSDVSRWIRIENLVEDVASIFDLRADVVATSLAKHTTRVTPYIKDPKFWFTDDEIANLYASNPLWASVEDRVYGDRLGKPIPQRTSYVSNQWKKAVNLFFGES